MARISHLRRSVRSSKQLLASAAGMCLAGGISASIANATTSLYFDPGAAVSGTGSGGSGSWDTTTTDWYPGTGTVDIAYNGSDPSFFEGTGGTVALNANISTSQLIEITSTGYTFNVGSNTLSTTGGANIGVYGNSTTNLQGTGGNFNVSGLFYIYATGTVNVSSGVTLNLLNTSNSAQGAAYRGGNSTGSNLIINTGGKVVADGIMDFAHSGGTGVITLNGGELDSTYGFSEDASTGVGLLNLSGGTIKFLANLSDIINGTASGPNFLGTSVTINDVGGGGTNIINTNGFNVGIAEPIVHSGTGVDGGLTLIGGGNLNLSGANKYTGPTNISAGILNLGASTTSSGNLNASSTVTIAPGASLNLGQVNTTYPFPIVINSSTGTSVTTGITHSSGNYATLILSGGVSLAGGGNIFEYGIGNIIAINTSPLTGTGPFSFSSAGATSGTNFLTINVPSTYSGNTIISSISAPATVNDDVNNAFPTTTVLSLAGGSSTIATVNLNGYNQSIAGLNSSNANTAIIGGGTLTLTNTTPQTYSGTIQGTTALTFAGTSYETLTGTNSYTGATTVSSGELYAFSTTYTPLSTSAVTVLAGGNVTIGNHAGAVPNMTNNFTLNGSGSSGSSVSASGTLAYGALAFFNSGNFNVSGGITLASNSVIRSDSVNQTTPIAFTGVISGPGSLTLEGGTSGAGYPYFKLTQPNTYGTTTPVTLLTSDGVNTSPMLVELSTSNNVLPVTTVLTFGGPPAEATTLTTYNKNITLLLDGINQTVAGLANGSSGSYYIAGNSATTSNFTVSNAAPYTFSGVFGGTGTNYNNLNLVLAGSSTLTLTASSTYTGTTNVSSGTLILASGGAIASPSVSVVLSAALNVSSGASISTSTALADAGAVNFFNSVQTISTLNGTGAVNLNGTALTISSGGTFSGSIADGTSPGSLNISGGTLTLSGTNTFSGGVTVKSGTLVAGAANTLSPNSAVNISGGTLNSSGYNNSIASLIVGSAGTLDLGYGNILSLSGTASFAGTLNLTGTPSVPETLISYASDSGTFNVANGVPSADKLVYTPTALEIVANGPSNLNWTGAINNVWDIATTPNWNTPTGASTTYSNTSNISSGDNVTFSDNNNGVYNVSVATVVSPSSVTFTNNTSGYTLTGATTSAGIAGPGALTLNGSGSVTLSTSNSYTGGTFVKNGTLILSSTASFPANTGLTISGGSVSLAPANSGNAVGILINGLSLTGSGTLNLNTNEAVIRGGSLSTVWTLAQTGYAGGAWNGSGGITSANATAGYISAATSGNGALTAVGVILNDTAGNFGNSSSTALYTTFGGVSTIDGDVLAKYTYYGDTNLSGSVDGSDYANIDDGYVLGLTGWYNGDFNYDRAVDGSDYTLMDNAYNSQGAQLSSIIASPDAVATDQIAGASGAAASAVPEPASLGLLGIGAIGLLGRRKSRRRFLGRRA